MLWKNYVIVIDAKSDSNRCKKNYKDIDFNIINLFDDDQLKAGSVTFQMSQSLLIFQIIYFQNSSLQGILDLPLIMKESLRVIHSKSIQRHQNIGK